MIAATFLAACGATAAILCTLALNAWHGWTQGNTPLQQYGMMAINITIDLIKCGGLPAVSALWGGGFRLRAVALIPLWALAFAWSTFCGYSAILSTRSTTNVEVKGQEQERTRAQRIYDEATATMDTAKTNPLWQASGGCTAIRPPHRAFCDGIAKTTTQRATAERTLTAVSPVQANPELSALAKETGQPLPWIIFMVALFPAVLLELIASVGYWAIGPRTNAKPSQSAPQRISKFWLPRLGRDRKTPPAVSLEASAVPSPGRMKDAVPATGFKLQIPRAPTPPTPPT